MREGSCYYEYLVRYVANLVLISKDVKNLITMIEQDHHIKIKGTGPIGYYLGCDITDTDMGFYIFPLGFKSRN